MTISDLLKKGHAIAILKDQDLDRELYLDPTPENIEFAQELNSKTDTGWGEVIFYNGKVVINIEWVLDYLIYILETK